MTSVFELSVVFLLLFFASISDIRSRKIPNYLVIFGLAIAVAHAGIIGGFSGLGKPLFGALVGLLIFLPLYAIRWVGAGDAKLMLMVGCFIGPVGVAWSALYSFAVGTGLGVLMLILYDGWVPASNRLMLVFKSLVFKLRGSSIPFPVETGSQSDRLPYAVAILFGTSIWAWCSGALSQVFMAS